jgi:hypothetical protein
MGKISNIKECIRKSIEIALQGESVDTETDKPLTLVGQLAPFTVKQQVILGFLHLQLDTIVPFQLEGDEIAGALMVVKNFHAMVVPVTAEPLFDDHGLHSPTGSKRATQCSLDEAENGIAKNKGKNQ